MPKFLFNNERVVVAEKASDVYRQFGYGSIRTLGTVNEREYDHLPRTEMVFDFEKDQVATAVSGPSPIFDDPGSPGPSNVKGGSIFGLNNLPGLGWLPEIDLDPQPGKSGLPGFDTIGQGIGHVFDTTASNVFTGTETVVSAFGEVGIGALDFVQEKTAGIYPAFEGIHEGVTDFVTDVAKTVKAGIFPAWEGIHEEVTDFVTDVTKTVVDVTVGDDGPGGDPGPVEWSIGAIGTLFTNGAGEIWEIVEGGVKLVGKVGGVAAETVGGTIGAVSDAAEGVGDLVHDVGSAGIFHGDFDPGEGTGLPGDFGGSLKNMLPWLVVGLAMSDEKERR